MSIVDALDRVIEFTLYVKPEHHELPNVVNWLTTMGVAEHIVLKDDRAGTGCWKVIFKANGTEIIEQLSAKAREFDIDVHMKLGPSQL